MTDEKKIKELFGNANHFDVPVGYFDNLTTQIMEQLPEQEARIVNIRPHHWWNSPMAIRKVAAAAAVVVATSGVMLALQYGASRHQQVASPLAQSATNAHSQSTSTSADDADFEQMADYTMMDSQDFYASLVAEN